MARAPGLPVDARLASNPWLLERGICGESENCARDVLETNLIRHGSGLERWQIKEEEHLGVTCWVGAENMRNAEGSFNSSFPA